MQKKHHYTDYQQDVDEASRNMKGQEPKQPQNDQNSSDYSEHVFNSFYLCARDKQKSLVATDTDFSSDSYVESQ